jgi:hypothetical protein
VLCPQTGVLRCQICRHAVSTGLLRLCGSSFNSPRAVKGP